MRLIIQGQIQPMYNLTSFQCWHSLLVPQVIGVGIQGYIVRGSSNKRFGNKQEMENIHDKYIITQTAALHF